MKNDQKWFENGSKWPNHYINDQNVTFKNDLDILNAGKNDQIHVDCISDTVPNERFI